MLALLVVVGCGGGGEPGGGDRRADHDRSDAGATDGPSTGGDREPRPDGGAEVCDNLLDDDGDGEVDEGCLCSPGAVRECAPRDVELAEVGECRTGMQTCEATDDEFDSGAWGPCDGAVGPSEEVCDEADNDCDGEVDEGCDEGGGGTEPGYGACAERCLGERRVFFNAAYGLWVQVILCSPQRYDILLGASDSGPFRKIGDVSGHGQDHCELVSPSFTIPIDDDVTSGTCATCSVASAGSVGSIPELWGTEMYSRSRFGEPFVLLVADNWGIHTSCSYECGVSF